MGDLNNSISFDFSDSAIEKVSQEIYTACDPLNVNLVPVSKLIEYITPFMNDNLEPLFELESVLDPEHRDCLIACDVFYKVMAEWTAKIKREQPNYNFTSSPRNELDRNIFLLTSTPKASLEYQQFVKNCADFLNSSQPPVNVEDCSSDNCSIVEKVSMEDQIRDLQHCNSRMESELKLVRSQLIAAEENNDVLQNELARFEKKLCAEQQISEHLKRTKDELEEVREQLLTTQAQLFKRDKIIAGNEKQISSLSHNIDELEINKGALESKLQLIQQKDAENKELINQLQYELNDKDQLINEIVSVHTQMKQIQEQDREIIEHFTKENEVLKSDIKLFNALRRCDENTCTSIIPKPVLLDLSSRTTFRKNAFNTSSIMSHETPQRNTNHAIEEMLQFSDECIESSTPMLKQLLMRDTRNRSTMSVRILDQDLPYDIYNLPVLNPDCCANEINEKSIHNELKELWDNCKSQHCQHKKELEDATHSISNLEIELTQLRDVNVELEKKIAEHEKHADNFKSEIDHQIAINNELQNRIKQFEEECARLKNETSSSLEQVINLQKIISDMENGNESVPKGSQWTSYHTANLQTSITQLEEQIDLLKNNGPNAITFEHLEVALIKLLNKLKEIANGTPFKHLMETSNHETYKKVSISSNRCSNGISFDRQQLRIERLNERIEYLEKEKDKKNSEITTMEQKLNIANSTINAFDQYTTELIGHEEAKYQKLFVNLRNELTEEKIMFEQECDRLSSELNILQEKYDQTIRYQLSAISQATTTWKTMLSGDGVSLRLEKFCANCDRNTCFDELITFTGYLIDELVKRRLWNSNHRNTFTTCSNLAITGSRSLEITAHSSGTTIVPKRICFDSPNAVECTTSIHSSSVSNCSGDYVMFEQRIDQAWINQFNMKLVKSLDYIDSLITVEEPSTNSWSDILKRTHELLYEIYGDFSSMLKLADSLDHIEIPPTVDKRAATIGNMCGTSNNKLLTMASDSQLQQHKIVHNSYEDPNWSVNWLKLLPLRAFSWMKITQVQHFCRIFTCTFRVYICWFCVVLFLLLTLVAYAQLQCRQLRGRNLVCPFDWFLDFLFRRPLEDESPHY